MNVALREAACLAVHQHFVVRENGVVRATVQVLALQDDAVAVPQQSLERGARPSCEVAPATAAQPPRRGLRKRQLLSAGTAQHDAGRDARRSAAGAAGRVRHMC